MASKPWLQLSPHPRYQCDVVGRKPCVDNNDAVRPIFQVGDGGASCPVLKESGNTAGTREDETADPEMFSVIAIGSAVKDAALEIGILKFRR